MKVLIFGPSGSGKTYLSSELKKLGINAVDADLIEGLSSWYDGAGKKVAYPEDADEEFLNNYSFLWDRKFLEDYLSKPRTHDLTAGALGNFDQRSIVVRGKNPDVYVFGASGNIFDMLDLFDKVYFLKVEPDLQKERLLHSSRENPMGDTDYQRENAVRWGQQLEKKAKDLEIEFIDAALSPQKIFKLMTSSPPVEGRGFLKLR